MGLLTYPTFSLKVRLSVFTVVHFVFMTEIDLEKLLAKLRKENKWMIYLMSSIMIETFLICWMRCGKKETPIESVLTQNLISFIHLCFSIQQPTLFEIEFPWYTQIYFLWESEQSRIVSFYHESKQWSTEKSIDDSKLLPTKSQLCVLALRFYNIKI